MHRDLILAVASARLMIADGRAADAAGLLGLWHAYARDRHCYRAAIAAGVLLAKAWSAAGHRRAAHRTLADCLQLGAPGRFMRTFLDEGPELLTLLSEWRDTGLKLEPQSLHGYLMAILDASKPGLRPLPAESQDHPSGNTEQELLSQRELQILSLAAQGNQNQDIAQSLFLAESTVKWYWQRIFDKLDVRRRPDAIKRARQKQWIA